MFAVYPMARSSLLSLAVVVLVAAAGLLYASGFFGTASTSTSSSSQLNTSSATSTVTSSIVYTSHVISFTSVDTSVDLGMSCSSIGGLPDPNCTPGAVDGNVTQANVGSTICVSGYTATVRPPTSYTNPRKVQSIQQYGYKDTNTSDYEYDHLISLELGGSPRDVRNLWAEPHYGNFTSFDKDGFENYLHHAICSGGMTLAEAQAEISTDWASYWVAAGRP